MSSLLSPNRRPGGQPGNTNAVKHGYYSTHLRQNQSNLGQSVKYTGVTDEIEMLRTSIRRIVEWGKDIRSLPDPLAFLRILALASASLSRLVRTQQALAETGFYLPIGEPIPQVEEELDEEDKLLEELDESDPTIQWAKVDPPEGECYPILPKFVPSTGGEDVEED